MNLVQITAFHAVMTSASLSEAAVKLGRTQPAVSAAIKALEENLGMKLFERSGRKLVPVPEAQYLLAESASILDDLNRVSRTMRSMKDGEAGTLRVAAMPGPMAYLFPKFIAERTHNKSDIRISIFARSSSQIEDLAAGQTIDFGFADAPAPNHNTPQYDTRLLSADCFCAVPGNHPLAQSQSISLRDLHDQPMGTLHLQHLHQKRVEKRFDSLGINHRHAVECQTFQPLLQFVMTGHVCVIVDPLTVLHAGAIGLPTDKIAFVPITDNMRYHYATFFPNSRPASRLSKQLVSEWLTELDTRLIALKANPKSTDYPANTSLNIGS